MRERCSHCLMHDHICICSEIPKLQSITKLIVIIHKAEVRKPTNTGRLAVQSLANAEMHVRGTEGSPVDGSSFVEEKRKSIVLFPSDDAVCLTPELVQSWGQPLNLIVPDGNWKQASRIPKREEALKNLTNVILPAGEPTEYRLRTEPRKPYGLATIEAIARAFGIIEGKEIEQQLVHIFRMMVERTLWTKGVLKREAVYGGIPSEARTP